MLVDEYLEEREVEAYSNEILDQERFIRTREDHSTETAEDYVELIEDLTREHGEARLVDMAKHLGVSHVTVNRTLGRLQKEGLVHTKPYRAIFLTEAGHKLADRSRRRHRTVFRLLRVLGVPAEQARLDAEGIEHHASAATLAAMTEFLKRHAASE